MTSAQLMFPGQRLTALMVVLIATGLCVMVGCTSKPTLHPPRTLVSAYHEGKVWAVAPFANESGVSTVSSDRVADLFTEQAEQIRGIRTVPVNRVLLAMRTLNMSAVRSPNDARQLVNLLDIDGLIVGTVTAYDPYPPPKFGASIQLFERDSTDLANGINPQNLTRSTRPEVLLGASGSSGPSAQASGVMDSSDHQTLQWLEEYASGRTEPASPYGRRIYLVNMELYTQFAAFRLLDEMLASIPRQRMAAQESYPR